MKLPTELRYEIYSYLPDVTTIHLSSTDLRPSNHTVLLQQLSVTSPAISRVNAKLKSELDSNKKQHIRIDFDLPFDIFYLDALFKEMPTAVMAHIKTIEFRRRVAAGFSRRSEGLGSAFNLSILLTATPSCKIIVSPTWEAKPRQVQHHLQRTASCSRLGEESIARLLRRLPHHTTQHRRVFSSGPFREIAIQINSYTQCQRGITDDDSCKSSTRIF